MAARRNTTTASLSTEATYTLLLSGLTATETAPSRPSVPMQLGGPVPVLPIHPAGVGSSPLAARRNTAPHRLSTEATYTLLPSWLTATPAAPLQAVDMDAARGLPVVLPRNQAGVRSPFAARRNTTSALLSIEATYTLLLSPG